ncbi:MAG TPA: exodeoxyribonuclease VII large subunit [Candidatus Competibacteraceae bacterium]|nr:exodeoxyribonuclease VII large subunit [Candidatus Competibacteraceae bacterium]
MDYATLTIEREIYTVSALNRAARQLLESGFPLIWLEGEVSNLSRPSSGHLYFSLKDSEAQVRCALFRNRALLTRTPLANGMQVLVRARVSLYEPRGDFQLIVEHLEEAGEGALRRAFEALKARLAAEGLFAAEHKLPLPRQPRRIGVITSPSGAAIRDVLSVLRRRCPALPVLVYPTPVQGDGAAQKIAEAIRLASARAECDVLLLVRGGGSLEDLWAFNEEAVARAIAECTIPIVSGVGHEVDVTIADFVADLRAPTPSAAAELVSPDQSEWWQRLRQLAPRLLTAARRDLAARRQRLLLLEQRLQRAHPGRRLQDRAQRLDELEQRLRRTLARYLERLQQHLQGLTARLRAQSPVGRVRRLEERQQILARRLELALHQHLARTRQRLQADARALQAVSPLATLGRGYAIVRDGQSRIVRRADQVRPGDPVEALLAQGRLWCRVESTSEP